MSVRRSTPRSKSKKSSISSKVPRKTKPLSIPEIKCQAIPINSCNKQAEFEIYTDIDGYDHDFKVCGKHKDYYTKQYDKRDIFYTVNHL